MVLNKHLSHQDNTAEQNLQESLIIEAIQARGLEVYYIPQEILEGKKFKSVDDIFIDVINQEFAQAYLIEMYLENPEGGFGSETMLMSKFGIDFRSEVTFTCSVKRWNTVVGSQIGDNYTGLPNVGDLIYMRVASKMFRINNVVRDADFYRLGKLYTYQLVCTLFEPSNEQLDTAVPEINSLEAVGYRFVMKINENENLKVNVGDKVKQILEIAMPEFGNKEISMHGEVLEYNKPEGILTLIHVGSNDTSYRVFDETMQVQVGDDENNTFTIVSTSQKLSDRIYQDGETSPESITDDNPDGDLKQFGGNNGDESFIYNQDDNPFGSPFNRGKK